MEITATTETTTGEVQAAVVPGMSSEPLTEEYIKRLLANAKLAGANVPASARFAGAVPVEPHQEVKIFKSHVLVKTSEGVEKYLSISDFRDIFESQFDNETKLLRNLALPFGTFVFGMTNSKIQISCYYPGMKRSIKFQPGSSGGRDYLIPFPNIIISHTLDRQNEYWHVHNTRYFCTPKKIGELPVDKFYLNVDAKDGIYHIPFSNFYTNNTLCYGNNNMPMRHTDNLRGLDYFFQVLTAAPFNNDLGITGLTKSISPEPWYVELSKLDEFPYKLLA